jgi:thioredoxin-related protein
MTRVPVVPSLLSLLLLLPTPAGAAAGPVWRTWDAGLVEGARLKRPVLVDVYTDWCGWCRRMDREVYARANVRDYLERRFVVVKLDAESGARVRYEGKTLASRLLALRLGVRSYPNTVFLAANGKRIGSVPGYLPADRFLLLLRYVADGHAERGESFDAFARAAGSSRGGRAGAGR